MQIWEVYAWLFFFNIFNVRFPDSSFKESDQDRQRNAEEVEDFRKQLAKAAAEACLHWLALAISDCVGNIAWQGWQIDSLAGIVYRYGMICADMQDMLGFFFDFFPG